MNQSARRVLTLFLLGIGCLAMGAPEATAQRWLQTSQLLTEIKQDSPTRALLDTLVQVIERKGEVEVKRTEEASKKLSLSTLRDKLINEQGIGLTSANFVFIDYRFEIQNRGFEESVESLQFVYRPPGGAEEDIQMLYVDASEPWVRNILENKGTTLVTNEAALKTFSDQLAFARLVQDGKIVEIAGQTVREGFKRKKRQLVQKIQRLTYESM
ncbi:MAG: hypothetical protein BRD55_03380 [Bacteroidetes bacterium SW_9_63_38]|nr:MAG: hypothetical protein BRD55_03380 [Bacteroidetes bacterium SW_9_63_38]